MTAKHERPEQAEAAQAEQTKLRKRRVGNDRHARLIADREAALYHGRKARELHGTHEGADHAAVGANLADRVKDRFDVSEYDVGQTERVAGGEIAPMEERQELDDPFAPALTYDVGRQLGDADILQRSASRDRLDMLVKADALALGVECAESMGASNTVEKMLTHEMAVAHTLGLKFAEKSASLLSSVLDWQADGRQQTQSTEACRLAGTSARVMKAVSDAAEALHKIRGGSPQRIIVQHVTVSEGGQAVVSGHAEVGGTAGRGRLNEK